MNKTVIIGVMGGGRASENDYKAGFCLGKLIAKNGWILLNGGRNCGIMEASAKGAAKAGGITMGILPGKNYDGVSEYIKIPVLTNMGDGRNIINVLTSNIVVACPGGAGTVSEIALALKSGKCVILMDFDTGDVFHAYEKKNLLFNEKSPEKVIDRIKCILNI